MKVAKERGRGVTPDGTAPVAGSARMRIEHKIIRGIALDAISPMPGFLRNKIQNQ
jgi:hypothetical protein